MDLALSSSGHGPDAHAHPKATRIALVVKADLHKAAVACEHVANLVHGRAPAEAAIDVIQDGRGVRLPFRFKEGVDLLTQALRSTHSGDPPARHGHGASMQPLEARGEGPFREGAQVQGSPAQPLRAGRQRA